MFCLSFQFCNSIFALNFCMLIVCFDSISNRWRCTDISAKQLRSHFSLVNLNLPPCRKTKQSVLHRRAVLSLNYIDLKSLKWNLEVLYYLFSRIHKKWKKQTCNKLQEDLYGCCPLEIYFKFKYVLQNHND